MPEFDILNIERKQKGILKHQNPQSFLPVKDVIPERIEGSAFSGLPQQPLNH